MLNCFFAYLTVAFADLKDREEGQGLVEYALILVLVSIVAIIALGALGVKISGVFNTITNAV